MKVVHLSTTTSGGAGRAAMRSVEALNQYGIEAILLDRNSELDSLKRHSLLRSTLISKSSSLITGMQSKIVQSGDELMTPLSLDFLTHDEERIRFLEGFDIIHMHAFFNFFSIRRLHSILPTVPKVVTLHDERLLTGGCHYATTCRGMQDDCNKCPKSRLIARPIVRSIKKREAIFWHANKSKDIKLILPSEWLKGRVKRVPQFAKLSTEVIHNCVPEAFFTSRRAIPSSNSNIVRIGFVSTDINGPYKGFEFFKEAIEKFASTQEVKVTAVLITSVKKEIESSPKVTWQLMSPKNDKDYITILDSIDVVCVPSVIDNSPNVVIEALARGIPVLASDSGGTGEIPRKISLPTFVYGSLNGFCSALQQLIQVGSLDASQEEKVSELVSERAHAKKLIDVYRSLI